MTERGVRVVALAALALACVLSAGVARADAASREAAEASCARAEHASAELRFAEALEGYRQAIATDPSAPCVRAARARVQDLEAHAEGGFVPLATVEAVRRDPQKLADAPAVEALGAAIAAFPPGRVRAEAYLTVAHAWQYGLKRPERAIAAYEAAVRDPGGDRLTRALALAELWSLRRERGELHEAAEDVAREPDLSPAVTRAVRRALARARMRGAAVFVLDVLGAVFVASVITLVRRARDVRALPGRLVRPFEVAFALYVGGASALLVRLHGEGDARPFLWFGIALLVLGAAARALVLAARPRSLALRATWAAACVAGLVAAAFLIVERADPSYLDGIGL